MAELPLEDDGDTVLDGLIARFFNGPLEEGDLESLEKRLAEDPEARRLFVRIAKLDGLLIERSLTDRHQLPSRMDLFDDRSEDSSQTSMHDTTVQPAIQDDNVPVGWEETITLPTWPVEPQPESFAKFVWSRLANRRAAAAAAVLVSVFFAGWALRSARNPSVIRSQTARVDPVERPPETATEPARVTLASAVRAEWDADSSAPAPGDTITDQPLGLKAGWVCLNFPNGVSAVVEAPARFRVRSVSRITLDLGRISAEVSPAGHGFTVESPVCRVVDLGTEFGMSVDDRGRNEVQVFQGQVTFARTVPTAASPEAVTLSVGEGRLVQSPTGPSVRTVADAKSFVRVEQFNRWINTGNNVLDQCRTADEQLSRHPGLMLFYTLDERDQNRLVNHAVGTLGRFDLSTTVDHGPSWVDGRLPGTSVLNFEAGKRQYLVSPECPITSTGKISCSTWAFAQTAQPFGSIVKNWGDSRSGTFHLGLTADGSTLEVELDGTRSGGPTLRDTGRFPVRQWVHIVFTSDGATLRLYRDGKEVASGPSRLIDANPPMKCLSIGCKTGDDGATPSADGASGFWDGQIGEIAVFDRVLTPQEILQMSKTGR